jgi:bisanhydrobacterioruberin hydratase
MSLLSRKNISIFIALLFHISGAIGILFSAHKNWFIANTTLNLLLMAVLLIANQQQKNKWFWLFVLVSSLVGFMAEIIGVHTGYLFGNYSYGNTMGWQIFNVPLLIGIQWFVTIYCCGVIMEQLNNWVLARMAATNFGVETSKTQKIVQKVSLIIDGGLMAAFFDDLMEPSAQKLGYWFWKDGKIPSFNFISWFLISCLLLVMLKKFPFAKQNHFALHLFIIQTIFFIALKLYL